MAYRHVPVLLNEALGYLEPQPGQNFVDATLGGGGYTRAILEKVFPAGKVLAIDLDPDARENFANTISGKKYAKNVVVAPGNFRDIDHILRNHKFHDISGIVADLGLSSHLIDEAGRGISFQKDEPLDMRFDPSGPTDAKFILNNSSLDELTRIFKEYGEDPAARGIAKAIVVGREEKRLASAQDLVEAITRGLPKPRKHLWQQSARRIFQAVRMAVNHELESLESFLPKAFDLLNPGGKMVIVSFHSLEDRVVKQFFAGLAKGCICPPDFPYCQCGRNPRGKILTKKPVTASEKEQQDNSRSIPAKLRAIQKIN